MRRYRQRNPKFLNVVIDAELTFKWKWPKVYSEKIIASNKKQYVFEVQVLKMS